MVAGEDVESDAFSTGDVVNGSNCMLTTLYDGGYLNRRQLQGPKLNKSSLITDVSEFLFNNTRCTLGSNLVFPSNILEHSNAYTISTSHVEKYFSFVSDTMRVTTEDTSTSIH